jgi:hypothetical protein
MNNQTLPMQIELNDVEAPLCNRCFRRRHLQLGFCHRCWHLMLVGVVDDADLELDEKHVEDSYADILVDAEVRVDPIDLIIDRQHTEIYDPLDLEFVSARDLLERHHISDDEESVSSSSDMV